MGRVFLEPCIGCAVNSTCLGCDAWDWYVDGNGDHPMSDEYLTVEEAGEFLSFSPATIRGWVRSGFLKYSAYEGDETTEGFFSRNYLEGISRENKVVTRRNKLEV